MHKNGQDQKSGHWMSALPPKADVTKNDLCERFRQCADVLRPKTATASKNLDTTAHPCLRLTDEIIGRNYLDKLPVGHDEVTRLGISPNGTRPMPFNRGEGIVTLTNNRPNLLLDHEAKPLKMRISTIGESPRFRCESD
jgi:hypothetical protein